MFVTMGEKYNDQPNEFFVEIPSCKSIVYVAGMDIEGAVDSFVRDKVEINPHFHEGKIFADITLDIDEEDAKRLLVYALYGKQIDRFVGRMNDEWRDKFYKNVNVRPVWKDVQPIIDEFEKAYEQTLP